MHKQLSGSSLGPLKGSDDIVAIWYGFLDHLLRGRKRVQVASLEKEHQGVLQPVQSSAHGSLDHWAPAVYSGWAWNPTACRCGVPSVLKRGVGGSSVPTIMFRIAHSHRGELLCVFFSLLYLYYTPYIAQE